MASQTFRLPDPGEGLVEADIITWRVAVGDEIKINDILLEVETSKSLVELPSPYAGTVTELLVGEGDTVAVGTPIVRIDDGLDAAQPVGSTGDGQEAQVPNLVGYGPRTGTAKRRPRRGSCGWTGGGPRSGCGHLLHPSTSVATRRWPGTVTGRARCAARCAAAGPW